MDDHDILTLMPDDETEPDVRLPEDAPWRVLLVDDEPAIHTVTQLALDGFYFDDRRLELVNAFSATEAKAILEQTPNFAVIVLDVVMETESAGLDLIDFIRRDLGNTDSRIVLRTGQPGSAPERSVIINYDIDDYKEKSELTAHRLYSLMSMTLRSYRDRMRLSRSKEALEKVLRWAPSLLSNPDRSKITVTTLSQISELVQRKTPMAIVEVHLQRTTIDQGKVDVLAALNFDPDWERKSPVDLFNTEELKRIEACAVEGLQVDQDAPIVSGVNVSDRSFVGLFIREQESLLPSERHVLDAIMRRLAATLEDMDLREERTETQDEMMFMLGGAVEERSTEPGNHVRRVSEISVLLGKALDLDIEDLSTLRVAAALHDIGNNSLPDAILHKPSVLTSTEWERVREHPQDGAAILWRAENAQLKSTAVVAAQHHERYDGLGYPDGLAGKEIHIFARIVSVADSIDSLGNSRPYRTPWPLEDVIAYLRQERGHRFDPVVVDAALERIEEIHSVRAAYPDPDRVKTDQSETVDPD